MNLKHVELHGLCVYSLESVYYIYTQNSTNRSAGVGEVACGCLWICHQLPSSKDMFIGNYILITCISVWYKLTLNMYDVALQCNVV